MAIFCYIGTFMKPSILSKKILIIFLLIFIAAGNFVATFAYWADSITGDQIVSTGNIDVGQWLEGTQIWTTDDFIEMITTDNNTGVYTLATDLDFNNITPATWTQTKDTVFSGSFDANNYMISNISLEDYRGIFGILDGATVKNLMLDQIDIDYTTNDNYTSGILAGRLQGENNVIDQITITNSTISNDNTLAGGLIGFASPSGTTSGSASISNIDILNSDISGGFSLTTYGNGGLIATANNFALDIDNINLSVDVVSTSTSNAGGLIGSVIGTSTLDVDDINISNSTIETQGNDTSLGAGGLIGLLNDNNHTFDNSSITSTTVTSQAHSGGVIGYANGSSDSLSIDTLTMTDTNVISSVEDATSGAGGVIGVLNDYDATLSNLDVSATVTATANANAGGLIAVSSDSSSLDIDQVNILNANITVLGTDTTLGAGGMVGILNGDNHTFDDVSVNQTIITSSAISGGLIGYANETNGQLSINDIEVLNSNISSSVSGTSTGVGGIIAIADGYQVNINDATISSIIQANASNAGGAIGFINNTVTSNLSQITITQSTINSDSTNGNNASGGVIGLVNGDGHTLSNIDVNQSNITGDSSIGGVIGRSETSDNGTITISQVSITNNQMTSTLTSGTSGAGGLIGRNRYFAFDISDIYINTSISVARSNIGGLIGFSRYGDFTVNRVVVVADFTIYNAGTTNNRGAAGLIGRNRDVTASDIEDVFITGYFQAKVSGSDTEVGILVSTDDDLNVINVRSAEVSYELDSGTVNVTSETLYNQMLGQNPAYATYTTSLNTISNSYWTTNFQNITNSSLWTYNSITHVYELN